MGSTIGILTSAQSFGDNYGAVLQAYALTTKLTTMGYQPEIIRYKVQGEYVNHGAPLIKRLQSTLFNSEMPLYAKKNLLINKLTHRSVNGIFAAFVKENLPMYNAEFVDFDYLKQNTPPFDMFVTGSDQVWNPIIHGNKNDPGYFLDFVSEGKKRIAYAPSMGVDKIPEDCKGDLKDYLVKFHALSIREKSGAQIIKDCCGIDVPVVLDPTLLLTAKEWDKVAKKPQNLPDKYIFCYKFGKSETMDKTIKGISKKYNLPIVTAPSKPEVKFKADFTIGPAEFLGAIKNASIVCADSFHATAFSIIYKTPFLIFPRHSKSAAANMNSRMQNILETFRLQDRYIEENEKCDFNTLFELSFDYAEKVLVEKRAESENYLKKALQDC